jgi:hypothetical protein
MVNESVQILSRSPVKNTDAILGGGALLLAPGDAGPLPVPPGPLAKTRRTICTSDSCCYAKLDPTIQSIDVCFSNSSFQTLEHIGLIVVSAKKPWRLAYVNTLP